MPKKKGGKKGAKIIDGVATNEMSREQLMAHCRRIQMELEREREERNFFMLEREKLFSLWNMTLTQLTVEKDRARLMEVQVADNEKEKEEEMNIHKQKLRYLMLEQSKKLSSLRLHHLERMRKMQDESRSIEKAMQETLHGKKRELQRAKLSIHEIIRGLQSKHCEDVSKIRGEYGQEIRRLESDFNRRLFIHQRNARVENVVGNLNLQKIEETEDILAIHENQLTDMKKFYNDMTTNNFAIISALQNDVEELKTNENRLLMEIKKMKGELKKQADDKKARILNSHLEQGNLQEGGEEEEDDNEEEVVVVNGGLKSKSSKNYYKELQGTRHRIDTMEKILTRHQRYSRMLENANEALLQRLLLTEKERDDLKETFSKAIIEIQKKSCMSKLITECKSSGYRRKQPEDSGMRREERNSPTYFDNFLVTHDQRDRGRSRFRRKNITQDSIQSGVVVVSDSRGQEQQQQQQDLNNLDWPRTQTVDVSDNNAEFLNLAPSVVVNNSGVVESVVVGSATSTDTTSEI